MINSRSTFSSLKSMSREELEALANSNSHKPLLLSQIGRVLVDRAECAERHISADALRQERTAAKKVRDMTVPGSFGSRKRA